jgi:hypothetical protein
LAEANSVAGRLKASSIFVGYLAANWSQALARRGEELFVPEHFFHQPAEAVAYRKYMSSENS